MPKNEWHLEKSIFYVKKLISSEKSLSSINEKLFNQTKIRGFFSSQASIKDFLRFIDKDQAKLNRSKYYDMGDFQTPPNLTGKICSLLKNVNESPTVLIEPTCGSGNFVLSAIKTFTTIKKIYCVELQPNYEFLFKLRILEYSLKVETINPEILFFRDNIFTHIFENQSEFNGESILILGNPPWATNSKLSSSNSSNLPIKNNLKKLNGFDAVTGKSNFDITEYILLMLLDQFKHQNATLAMLCKTTVSRNIVRDIDNFDFKINDSSCYLIDSFKEFKINADANFFITHTSDARNDYLCKVFSLYKPEKELKTFGWINGKFASNIANYEKVSYIDGLSSIEWRQGVKHDAAKIFILKTENKVLVNGLNEVVDVENERLYPFVKSSQLKNGVLKNTDYRMILTQKKVGDSTDLLKKECPKLWSYLESKSQLIDKRKSIIYKNRPKFSIFGIGDYSFYPYKVALSGMYKKPNFTLLCPINSKPVLLDDTSYFLGFDSIKDAFFSWALLNSSDIKSFLSSVSFIDSKRPYTKELLMRIDLSIIAKEKYFEDLTENLEKLSGDLGLVLTEVDYLQFKENLIKQNSKLINFMQATKSLSYA